MEDRERKRKEKNHSDAISSERETERLATAEEFLTRLRHTFSEAAHEEIDEFVGVLGSAFWDGVVDKLWAFGPRRVGANMLINAIPGYFRKSWIHSASRKGGEVEDDLDLGDELDLASVSETSFTKLGDESWKHYEGSINTGFQVATVAGPLCAEPVVGVAYFVTEIHIDKTHSMDGISGHIISTIKEACNSAFNCWSPRLMLAMYSCNIQAQSEVLGKVYAVLSKRRGIILSEEMKEGTPFFDIQALLPVVESFGFGDEIRKKSSGAATPQLVFNGYVRTFTAKYIEI